MNIQKAGGWTSARATWATLQYVSYCINMGCRYNPTERQSVLPTPNCPGFFCLLLFAWFGELKAAFCSGVLEQWREFLNLGEGKKAWDKQTNVYTSKHKTRRDKILTNSQWKSKFGILGGAPSPRSSTSIIKIRFAAIAVVVDHKFTVHVQYSAGPTPARRVWTRSQSSMPPHARHALAHANCEH